MAAATLDKVARTLVVLVVAAAPWLLGYFPGAGSHWLDGVFPLLAQYEAPVMMFHAAIVLAAACWLAAGRLRGIPRLRARATDVAALALLGLMALATLTSVYRHASLVELHRILGCFLLFLLARAMARDAHYRDRLAVALVASCSLVALLGLRHYVLTAVLMRAPNWREFGTFGNPNSFAGLLIMAIPLAAGLVVRYRSGPARILCGTAAAVMLVTLFTTGSKGGMLALFLALIVFVAAVVWPATGSSRARKAAVVAAAAAPIVLALVLPPMRARLVTAFTTQSHSGAFRYYTWVGTVRMIAAKPWLGFGPGTFATAYPGYTVVGFSRMAHSKDLQVAAECGVPAAVALAALFFAYFIAVARRVMALGSDGESPAYGERALLVGCAASVVAFGLHCLVDYDWHIPALALTVWLLMGLSSGDAAAAEPGPADGRHPDTAAMGGQAPWRRVALWIAAVAAGIALCSFPVRVLAAGTFLQRARAAGGQHDFGTAHRELRRALGATPGNAALHYEMAQVIAATGRGEQPDTLWSAIGWMQEAAARQPTEASYEYRLAQLYRAVGDTVQAMAAADRAVSRSPGDTRVLLQLASLQEGAGQFDDAHELYVRIDELWHSPVGQYQAIEEYVTLDYAYAWLHLAQLAAAEGNGEQLRALKRRSIELLEKYDKWAAQQARMARYGVGVPPPDTAAAEGLRAAFEALDPA